VTLKILHWYPDFLHGGGVANAVLGLAAAQSRHGAHVVVAAAAPAHLPLYEPMDSLTGVDVLTWHPARTLRIAGQSVRVARERDLAKLTRLQADIVHVHGELHLDNLRVSRLFRCPIVISPHGACHPAVLAKSRRMAKRLYLAAERLLLRNHLTMFHALCPAEAKHLVAVFPRAASYCVPQGPSVLVPQTAPAHATRQAAAGQQVRLLFVGRLDVFTKGLDILLEALGMAASRAGSPHLHLTLAGPDWKGGRTRLEHQITELGLGDRVEFTGPLTGGQVGAVLAAADIYVQLSRHDGFALSAVEALLANKPVILSSAVGAISYPEIASLPQIKIVPPAMAEAALAIIKAAEELPQMRSAAICSHQAVAEFFCWDRVARLHLNQYMQLVHN
jgi:glycosyltransferase involved in cell wall biosynthesis